MPTRSSAPAVGFHPPCLDGSARAIELTNDGAGFGVSADHASLTADGTTSSCAAPMDKSAYWTPIPYFKDASTGEYEAVGNVGGMLA